MSFVQNHRKLLAAVVCAVGLAVVWRYNPYPAYQNVFYIVIFAACVGFVLFGKLKSYQTQMNLTRKLRGKSKTSGAHGTADFATWSDIRRAELTGSRGYLIGKFEERFVRFHKAGHLITFAPTRSGKGVGHVIPNLLDHPGSVVVNDIKGENFAITGRHRATFSKVVTFAPFADKSSCYNPLEFIRLGTNDELDDVQLISDLIILEDNSNDPFWSREAKNLITALMLHVATSAPPALKNMGEVRYLLMQSKKDFDYTIKEMVESKNAFVRRAAGALTNTEAKVLASVISTAKSQTAVWDSPRLKAITSRSDFKLEDLKGDVPVSLYIVIPPEYLDVYKPVVRLMMGVAIASMTRTQSRPKIPVLFLIDEFPALGFMKIIETGIGYLAGYGVNLWMFIQDLSQLKDNYPKWASFIANCSVRVAFGTNDVETAKTLSEMLGTTTISVESEGKQKKVFSMGLFDDKSINTSETGRSLMTPDEVMRMPNDAQIIFVQGVKPIVAEKIRYFADRAFKGKFDKW